MILDDDVIFVILNDSFLSDGEEDKIKFEVVSVFLFFYFY